MIVLGIDPGFASLGVAALRLLPKGESLLSVGVIRTEKSGKKREVRASEDRVRRTAEISAELHGLVAMYRPCAFATEAMSFSRDAKASYCMGLAWGVIVDVAQRQGIPIVQASPQEIKKALCGRKDASKDDVILAIEARYPSIEWPKQTTLYEHAADAVGAVVACLDSNTLRMARRVVAANEATP